MHLFGFRSPLSVALDGDTIAAWTEDVRKNPLLSFASTVAYNSNVQDTLLHPEQKAKYTTGVFNTVVTPEPSPRMDQKESGRCWLFAATNILRIPLMRKYNLEKFELSPAFLFFYDKLEKANYFLEQIVKTADEEVDSRIVQQLVRSPASDGGQFTMFANIIAKYGVVPGSVYGENVNTENTDAVNSLVTTLLRQYAQELREAVAAKKDPKPLQRKQIQRIHQLLVVFLGAPPAKFDWEYTDKDKKFHTIKGLTPLSFYHDVIGWDAKEGVSLLHDPRNEFERPVRVQHLGNVVEAEEVGYFNVGIDVLATKAVERLKENKPVFFGAQTPIYHHSPTGIIDTELWDYKSLGFDPKQAKADRLRYRQSLMSHAMVFTGVHLDDDGKPLHWKVENSWGKDEGKDGFFTLSHAFFKEYVFQVVVDKSEIPEYDTQLDLDPIELPPWDPCGALATN